MASTLTKRPLPALVALLALLLLTALVWWRVLHRSDGGGTAAASCPAPTSVATTLPAPARITVVVLNATKRSGIAARARTALVADGFLVPRPAANDSPKAKVPGVAEIRYGPAAKSAATLLRYYFPGARMVTSRSASASVVVSLGARYRSVAAPATVQAALRHDDVVVDAPASDVPGTGSSPRC